ncbi:MAG: hypothetical protein MK132_21820 [Lentisphaerales bacterium]|nr:hypothetical protein [Lentisphaerales bacterium]
MDLSYRSIDGEPLFQTEFAQFLISENESLKPSIYGQFFDQNEYDANDDGFTDLVKRDNLTLVTYLWWTPDDSTRIKLNYL